MNYQLKIMKLEALLKRLSKNHPKFSNVEKEFANRMAGYKGERSIEYYLSFLNEDFLIFHGLRLKDNKYYFQMDILILTPSYIIIIEVKNFSGTLIFDQTNNQLIREINDKEEGFQDPINQVKHQKFQLKRWLRAQKFPDIPVETFVVITNPNTIIKVAGGIPNIKLNVFKSANLLSEIEKVNEYHKASNNEFKKELTRLSNRLINLHTPYNPDILNQFSISKKEIITGVYCEICSSYSMERIWGKWICPYCSSTSKKAHLNAIKDYYLLIDTSITNKQFRSFIHLSSRTTSYKLLSSLNFKVTGSTCDKRYHILIE